MKIPPKQGIIETPLNRILGVESHVRILRELIRSRYPIGRTELARRIGLDPAGVRRALSGLMRLGVVESFGIGSRQQVQIREKHPLVPSLVRLFADEGAYATELFHSLHAVLSEHGPQILTGWAWTTDVSGDIPALEVAVIAPLRELAQLQGSVQPHLEEIGRRFNVMIDFKGYARADIETWDVVKRHRLVEAIPLYGPSPAWYLEAANSEGGGRGKLSSHNDADRRLLKIGRALARKIGQDPSLVDRALEYAIKMSEEAPAGERETMREWRSILETQPLARVQYILKHPGERATRLRQSLPFLNGLTAMEREELFAEADRDT